MNLLKKNIEKYQELRADMNHLYQKNILGINKNIYKKTEPL